MTRPVVLAIAVLLALVGVLGVAGVHGHHGAGSGAAGSAGSTLARVSSPDAAAVLRRAGYTDVYVISPSEAFSGTSGLVADVYASNTERDAAVRSVRAHSEGPIVVADRLLVSSVLPFDMAPVAVKVHGQVRS